MAQASERSPEQAVLTVAEAADFLRISARLLYRLVSEQAVPHTRIAGALRFTRVSLAAWLEQRIARSLAPTPEPMDNLPALPPATGPTGITPIPEDLEDWR